MAWLKANNFEVPVADGQADESIQSIGDTARAWDGTLVTTTIALKRTIDLTTPPLAAADAEPLRCLLQGGDVIGQSWSFDDTNGNNWQWSSKGLGKASGTGSSLGSGKFGAGVRIAAGGQVTWVPGAATNWTVMVWRKNLGVWRHWVLCSDGTQYQDGAAYVGSITWIAFSGSTLTLGDSGSSGNQDFDDLVFLPCVVTADMAAAFAASTVAFSELPRLTLTGDVIPEGTRTVEAEDVRTTPLQAALSGGWTATARQIAVSLVEA